MQGISICRDSTHKDEPLSLFSVLNQFEVIHYFIHFQLDPESLNTSHSPVHTQLGDVSHGRQEGRVELREELVVVGRPREAGDDCGLRQGVSTPD